LDRRCLFKLVDTVVPLVTCRVAALFAPRDIPMEERIKSDQIQEALKRGWRYVGGGSGGYWLKDGVKFVHMHNYILEVLDRGQYEDLGIEGRVVVDLGAGFGETAVYFLERGAKFVVALEPCPNAFKEMLTNLTLNGLLDKVAAINAGVGGKSGYRTLLCPKPIKAPLISLDRLLKLLPAGVVVKMDCEGCEYEALTSASNDSLRKVDEWSIEYHGSPKPLVEKLEASGFEVYVKGPWTWSVGFIHAKKP